MALISGSSRTNAGRIAFYVSWIPLLIIAILIASSTETGRGGWIILQLLAIGIATVISKIVDKIAG